MIQPSLTYNITAAGLTQLLDLDNPVIAGNSDECYWEFFFRSTGVVTLVGDVSIAPDPADVPTTDLVVIRWGANLILNGNTVTIFGVVLNQGQALTDMRIECRYDPTSTAWTVAMLPDISEINLGYLSCTNTDMIAGGSTVNLTPGLSGKFQRGYSAGLVALAGSWVFQIAPGYVPVLYDEFWFQYDATLTVGANSVTIFGETLTTLQALSGKVFAHTIYDGTAWRTAIFNRSSVDDFRVMASAADTAPAYLDSKVAKSVVVAANKIELSGDSAAPGNYQYYGTNGAGVKSFYPIATNTLLFVDVQIAHADILTLFTVPYEVIANPGAAKGIYVISGGVTIVGALGVVTPYATNVNLILITDTATRMQYADVEILTSTVDRTGVFTNAGGFTGVADTMILPNKGLTVSVQVGNPTGGLAGQYIKVKLLYMIVDIP